MRGSSSPCALVHQPTDPGGVQSCPSTRFTEEETGVQWRMEVVVQKPVLPVPALFLSVTLIAVLYIFTLIVCLCPLTPSTTTTRI